MIKRMSKATSLLVAAAAIISIVPANAADYQKVESKEGTIYNAIAYKDGKYYIDGSVEGKDDAASYLADGKYNALADVDSGSTVADYGTKYANVENGDYFVDLENGTVTTDSVKSDAEDDAASALRKKVKNDNDGRFDKTDADKIKTLTELPGAEFSQDWYSATYNKVGTPVTTTTIYTDANGNYIDADYYLGKIKVSTTGSSANVENTKDAVDFGTGQDNLSASIQAGTVLGQDANYIYRKAVITLTATGSDLITQVYGKAVTNSAFTTDGTTAVPAAGSSTVVFNVIQKISKAQASGSVDGAKYAKSVTNYLISDDSAAAKTLLGDATATDHGFSVTKDGKIISYKYDGTKVYAEAITLKSKESLYYTDISGGADTNVQSANAYKFDVDGNLWALDSGYIKKFDNSEDFNKVYKVDGSFDKMSVYDKDNIVAWSEGDEVYSVIGNKAADTTDTTTTTPPTTDTTTTTPVVNKGWVNTNAGWTFYNNSGVQAKGQWVNDGGVWYYIKADGVMATGWVKDGSNWYFLNGSGAMATGWVNDNGTWYFLNGSGAMATGWLNDNGTWYYLNASGAMLANTTVEGYKLGANGAWIR